MKNLFAATLLIACGSKQPAPTTMTSSTPTPPAATAPAEPPIPAPEPAVAQNHPKPEYGMWGFDREGMNATTSPGNNFYEYANGGWLKNTPIPADKSNYGMFSVLSDKIVPLEPEEAELAKLYTNTWRYIKFATANQFWMMANDFGLDFERIRHAIRYEYPRAADIPGPGFAAGPCLLKDTMQLAAFNNNNFVLGHTAMLINEGLPLYLVSRLEHVYDLSKLTVGVLGMAFKGGSDDPRESLAYKLRKILLLKAANVMCTDPYIADPRFSPLDDVLDRADLLVIAAPHPQYRDLVTDKPVADMWGIAGRGMRI